MSKIRQLTPTVNVCILSEQTDSSDPALLRGFEQLDDMSSYFDTRSPKGGVMQRSDIRAVGELAGEASSVLTTLVRGMHAGIASRVFDSIGPTATPTRQIG